MDNLQEELQKLKIKKIDYFKNVIGINKEQFKVIEKALKNTSSFDELNALTKIFDQRVGFGFKFDEAPNLKNETEIPVLEKDENRCLKGISSLINGKTPPQPSFDYWRQFGNIAKFINLLSKPNWHYIYWSSV